MKVGDKYSSNRWGDMTVVEYINSKNVIVVFAATGNKYTAQKYAILKGLVVDVEESKRKTLQQDVDRKTKFLEERSLAKSRREAELQKKLKEKSSKLIGRAVWLYTVDLLYACRKHINAKASKLKQKISSAKWYEKNREKAIQKASMYQKSNVERTRVRNRNRRARRASAEGTHTLDEVTNLLYIQDNKCACCKAELTDNTRELDHIMPLALGGTNYISNLQWLCQFCNSTKNATHPDEWALYLNSTEFKKRRLERLSNEHEDWKSTVQSMPLLAEFLLPVCSELVQPHAETCH